MESIRILCYGDSNTWGAIVPGKEHPYERNNKRWTKLLAEKLGKNYEVIEEGFIARTAGCDDIRGVKGNRNGATNFVQYVCSHDPLNYIILMLGTNDVKRFNKSPEEIAVMIEEKYINLVRQDLSNIILKIPQFIIVSPPIIEAKQYTGAKELTSRFNNVFEELALKNNCLFVNNSCLKLGPDGVHMSTEGHQVLAEKLEKVIKNNTK